VIRASRIILAALCCLGSAPAAEATSSTSSNWAGYAVMRSGLGFHRVSAAWTVPTVDCSSAGQQWSAVWVGLGGYRNSSPALEQVGTEADCSNGSAHYSAWYELVPAVSRDANLRVSPGDRVTASVTVTGRRVRLRLANDTTGHVFARTLSASVIDVNSAEWIVEAPSACTGSSGSCRIMPLANFGTTHVTSARATTAGGHSGPIGDPAWSVVAITLASDVQRFDGPGRAPGGGATNAAPSALDPAGGAFDVTWSGS
jgi:hypothetical protein